MKEQQEKRKKSKKAGTSRQETMKEDLQVQ
jgi:hypothetical protein